MSALIQTFLALFGKAGLKAIDNTIATSDLFQGFIKELILKRVEGLKGKYPELYVSLEGYVSALAKFPAIFTDSDPDNVEQVALVLRLKAAELQAALAETTAAAEQFESRARALKFTVDLT